MIIHGDDKGSIGLLLSIDGADGVVKLENRPESRDEITMTNIKLLCKVPNNQAINRQCLAVELFVRFRSLVLC